jgi:hypothetical protein
VEIAAIPISKNAAVHEGEVSPYAFITECSQPEVHAAHKSLVSFQNGAKTYKCNRLLRKH